METPNKNETAEKVVETPAEPVGDESSETIKAMKTLRKRVACIGYISPSTVALYATSKIEDVTKDPTEYIQYLLYIQMCQTPKDCLDMMLLETAFREKFGKSDILPDLLKYDLEHRKWSVAKLLSFKKDTVQIESESKKDEK